MHTHTRTHRETERERGSAKLSPIPRDFAGWIDIHPITSSCLLTLAENWPSIERLKMGMLQGDMKKALPSLRHIIRLLQLSTYLLH